MNGAGLGIGGYPECSAIDNSTHKRTGISVRLWVLFAYWSETVPGIERIRRMLDTSIGRPFQCTVLIMRVLLIRMLPPCNTP